ncbi:TetR/AcrR family transcriptional regulator [Streptomyces sp. NPDC057702]|uniref:TetR/AcrR family transcriptional regulator n=1 Tax=unclassified Streptomyces TaxID=2593676 RepID=UPI0036817AA0
MSAHTTAPDPPSLRQRRRAAATREILAAAELQITEQGPAALSLRAVARSLDMTVQALYHYFPSRDALVTALVAKAYDDLADAVRQALENTAEEAATPRLVAAAEGYRRWAVAHPERFQLIYGTPLRYYTAPVEGPTTLAMRRLSALFQREVFAGFTPAQLAAADTPALSPDLRARLAGLPPDALGAVPPPAVYLLMSAWGQLHGLVVLEVFGHTAFLGDAQAEIFRAAMHALFTDLRRRIADGAPGGAAGPGKTERPPARPER